MSASNWVLGATAVITAIAVIFTVPAVANYVESFSGDSWAQIQAWMFRIGLPVAESFAAYIVGFSFARYVSMNTAIKNQSVKIDPKELQLAGEVHFEVSFDSERLRYGFVEVTTISPYGEKTVISPYIENDRGTLEGIFRKDMKTRLRWVVPHTAATGEYAVHVKIGSYVLRLDLQRKKRVFRTVNETITINPVKK